MSETLIPAQGPVDGGVSQHADCYTEDGQPMKCWKCGGTEITEKVRDMLDVWCGQGPVMEFECVCGNCGESVGYWAHGYYDPGYMDYHRKMMVANVNYAELAR